MNVLALLSFMPCFSLLLLDNATQHGFCLPLTVADVVIYNKDFMRHRAYAGLPIVSSAPGMEFQGKNCLGAIHQLKGRMSGRSPS